MDGCVRPEHGVGANVTLASCCWLLYFLVNPFVSCDVRVSLVFVGIIVLLDQLIFDRFVVRFEAPAFPTCAACSLPRNMLDALCTFSLPEGYR